MCVFLAFIGLFVLTYLTSVWVMSLLHVEWKDFSQALMIFVPLCAAMIAYAWQRYQKTVSSRLNAIVKLELSLNYIRDGLVLVADCMQGMLDKGIALYTSFPDLDIPLDVIHGLGRITVKNDALSILISLHRVIRDGSFMKQEVEKLDRKYNSDYDEIIKDKNHDALLSRYPNLIKYCRNLTAEVDRCLIDVRFFAGNDRPMFQHLPYYSEQELCAWRIKDAERLKAEVEESRANSPCAK